MVIEAIDKILDAHWWYKYRNKHEELTSKLELEVRTEDGARLFCCDGWEL